MANDYIIYHYQDRTGQDNGDASKIVPNRAKWGRQDSALRACLLQTPRAAAAFVRAKRIERQRNLDR